MSREDPAFKIRNANLPLFVLHVLTPDLAALKRQLDARLAQTPDFFANTPVALNLAAIAETGGVPDFADLVAFMQTRGLHAAGVQGGSPAQRDAAVAAGLGLFMESRAVPRPEVTAAEPPSGPAPAPGPEPAAPVQAELPGLEPAPDVPEPVSVAPEAEAVPVAPMPGRRPTLVIDKPVRTGQRIYAEGADLVVLAIVNAGAELIADGDIHIYAPLRGRALAGARGDVSARIYTQAMEGELVAIAGYFQVFEEGVPMDVRGRPAQIFLEGERVVLRPLAAVRV